MRGACALARPRSPRWYRLAALPWFAPFAPYTVSGIANGGAPPKQWWPGSKYVTWVGIFAYFRHPYDRWAIVFSSTLASVVKFSTAPILIAETAVGPWRDRPRMIRNLFAGLTRHYQLPGFTYFDLNKSSQTEDWRLDGHKQADAAFKKGAPAYLRLPR